MLVVELVNDSDQNDKTISNQVLPNIFQDFF